MINYWDSMLILITHFSQTTMPLHVQFNLSTMEPKNYAFSAQCLFVLIFQIPIIISSISMAHGLVKDTSMKVNYSKEFKQLDQDVDIHHQTTIHSSCYADQTQMNTQVKFLVSHLFTQETLLHKLKLIHGTHLVLLLVSILSTLIGNFHQRQHSKHQKQSLFIHQKVQMD